jgi:hypothetical protein
MKLLRLTRVRAFAMLLAVGLGLAAQLAATAAMAEAMASPTETQLSAAHMCPGCGGGGDMGTPAQCGTVFCWNMVAVPAAGLVFVGIEPARFAPARYENSAGLAPRPDPYPPRTTFHS